MTDTLDKQHTAEGGSDVPTCSTYVLLITDAHGKSHTFGPLDLPDQISDQGETWDNIAAMESAAMDYVRDTAECCLHVPIVHDESLENDKGLATQPAKIKPE